MTASVDYTWFRAYRRGSLYEYGYCLTLIRDMTPVEFLDRLGAEPRGEVSGFENFAECDMEFQDGQEVYGDFMFVGATAVSGHDGPWTLAVEINGTLGTSGKFMGPLSTGTQIVSHFRNINALTFFSWWQDGELRTTFEGPLHRSGSDPDALVDAMGRAGFDLVDGGGKVEASFALAEDLTGVRITSELLNDAVYTAGIVEIPTPQ